MDCFVTGIVFASNTNKNHVFPVLRVIGWSAFADKHSCNAVVQDMDTDIYYLYHQRVKQLIN